MKQSLIGAHVLAAVAYAGSSACLYCRNQDTNGGILVSYSYCEHTDECLQDSWNYINRECLTEWTRGNSLSLEQCEPEEVTCPEYTSTPEKYQSYENRTHSMAAGSQCEVIVDASQGVARVIFSSTSYLGIEYGEGEYAVDDVITIENTVQAIKIYNAAESGPITFGISFSGASSLVSTALAAATVLALSSF